MCGICLECAWKMNVQVICTECVWKMFEYVGNMRGTGVDHAWRYGAGMAQPGIATTLLKLRPCLLSNR